jgi:hypothetical protein
MSASPAVDTGFGKVFALFKVAAVDRKLAPFYPLFSTAKAYPPAARGAHENVILKFHAMSVGLSKRKSDGGGTLGFAYGCSLQATKERQSMPVLFWRRTDLYGLERLALDEKPDRITAMSTVMPVREREFGSIGTPAANRRHHLRQCWRGFVLSVVEDRVDPVL